MDDEYSSGSDDETIIIDFDGAGCCGRRYAVLTEQKIRQKLSLEAAMTAEELSVPEDWALALLFHYRWRAYDLQHDWESDQAAVRDAVGLPGAGDTAPDRDDEEDKETTVACGICLEARPAAAMASAGCALRFCHGGCGSIVCAPPCSYRFCWRCLCPMGDPYRPRISHYDCPELYAPEQEAEDDEESRKAHERRRERAGRALEGLRLRDQEEEEDDDDGHRAQWDLLDFQLGQAGAMLLRLQCCVEVGPERKDFAVCATRRFVENFGKAVASGEVGEPASSSRTGSGDVEDDH
ncbi:probable E3 ubiquitin-protein ligase ARI8 [Setaria italica]|uniref:probable E3 ubiquitin-protein ligase ARI8 n=1 Tax=Setaria italica TaxID=4555 RepID=UPI00035119DC|nr:probable E3 ubiquitin-protein ligase ARI8 [Setaria italica]